MTVVVVVVVVVAAAVAVVMSLIESKFTLEFARPCETGVETVTLAAS